MKFQTLKVGFALMLAFGHAGLVCAHDESKARSLSETSAQSVGGLLVLSLMGSAVSL